MTKRPINRSAKIRIVSAICAGALLGTALSSHMASAASLLKDPGWNAIATRAIQSDHRQAQDRKRDIYRHPRKTLAFLGLKPGMTVVEISPATGWYTDIIAPIIGPKGKLYLAVRDPKTSNLAAKVAASHKKKPDPYSNAQITHFDENVYDAMAPAGSADMVLTFRSAHGWYMGGYAPEAFAAFYRALKPGGVLGLVEHRLPENHPDSDMLGSGYMKVSTIKALAKAAGFKFVGSSEVNANPKDTANHPNGVWNLPPTLRVNKNDDPKKYLAIGESDRMTLRFIKPKK